MSRFIWEANMLLVSLLRLYYREKQFMELKAPISSYFQKVSETQFASDSICKTNISKPK